MKKEFTDVNRSAQNAKEQFERTFKVYNFLKEHKGEQFRPKELAEKIGFVTTLGGYLMPKQTYIEHSKVVRPLYWLKAMGLVNYDEVREPIEIEAWGYRTKTKEVDGEIYTRRYFAKGEKETIMTSKKYWYAL